MNARTPTLFLAIIVAITNYINEHDQSYTPPKHTYIAQNQDLSYKISASSSSWRQSIHPYRIPQFPNYQQKTIQNSSKQLNRLQLRKWKLYNS